MPSRFVKQPNGLFAVFSTVVDTFTWVNLTASEAITVAIDELDLGRNTAEKKVQAAIDELDPWTYRPGAPLSRWTAALETVVQVHGDAARLEILREIEGPAAEPRFTVSRAAIEAAAARFGVTFEELRRELGAEEQPLSKR